MSDHESDQDSLFGSPPPSPGASRTTGGLALPGNGNEISMLSSKNVGTIALPGSQCLSELSNNPLASLSVYPRPPAPPETAAESSRASPAPANNTSNRQSSVPSSGAPSTPQPHGRPPTRRKRTVSPRRLPPEIPMPDPSQPPPANFLRNQSALLGTAGLVSGVRPMTLPQHNSRGQTAHNPIVIEEEEVENSNVQNRPKPSNTRTPLQKEQNPNNPSTLLPLPANDEIVDILIRQKNILPILQGILKLLKPKPAVPTPAPKPPATKKRKLNSVPAGAGDWDVPYPFAEGEGPKQYRETWEETRGRELLLQLRKMISDATKTAAMRRYLAQQERVRAEAYASGYHHGISAAAAKGKPSQQPSALNAARRSEPQSSMPNAAAFDFTSKQEDGVNALIASMLANSAQHATNSSNGTSASASQGAVDDWMSILQAFPSQNEGLPPQAFAEPPMASLLPPDQDLSFHGFDNQAFSTPGNFSAPPAFFDNNFDQSMNVDMSNLFSGFAAGSQASSDVQMGDADFDAFMKALQDPSSAANQEMGSGNAFNHEANTSQMEVAQPIPDALIDPTLFSQSLLDYSHMQLFASTPSLSRESSIPLLSASPMPSMSDMEPLTPSSSGWEVSVPEVFGEEGVTQVGREIGGQGPLLDEGAQLSDKAKGKRKQPGNSLQDTSPRPSPNRSNDSRTATGEPAVFIPASSQPFVVSDKLTRRSEILRRAKERQKQLADEIVRVRGELWETTIEQGVLAQLAHHYTSGNGQV